MLGNKLMNCQKPFLIHIKELSARSLIVFVINLVFQPNTSSKVSTQTILRLETDLLRATRV